MRWLARCRSTPQEEILQAVTRILSRYEVASFRSFVHRVVSSQTPRGPANWPRYANLKLAMHVLPCAVPDMNPHGCRRNAIDDYVPSVCNRKAALAAPGCRYANSRVFEDQIERVLYALSDKRSGARVFASDVSKGINVGLQRPRRPLKPPGGACGHAQRRSWRVFGAVPLHAAHTRAASHHVLRLCFRLLPVRTNRSHPVVRSATLLAECARHRGRVFQDGAAASW